MSALSYSKWDHIEVSDDEDDTHPNIDTGSLFRWRHQARVERQQNDERDRQKLDEEIAENKKQIQETEKALRQAEKDNETMGKLQKQLDKLMKEKKTLVERDHKLTEEHAKRPLNIDTICKEGRSATRINKASTGPKKKLTEEEKMREHQEFVANHKKEIKHYGMLRKYQDSQEYLLNNLHLVCEYTSNYLCIWCIDLAVEEKFDLMEHVAHQCVAMNFILEFAKMTDSDPKDRVRAFFARLKFAKEKEPAYYESFLDELVSFKERIRGRAKERINEAMRELEEEERQKRLGPGGLDPVEVYESLPAELQKCFDTKDKDMFLEVASSMDPAEFQKHYERCVASGLWVPSPAESDATSAGQGESETVDGGVEGPAEKHSAAEQ